MAEKQKARASSRNAQIGRPTRPASTWRSIGKMVDEILGRTIEIRVARGRGYTVQPVSGGRQKRNHFYDAHALFCGVGCEED